MPSRGNLARKVETLADIRMKLASTIGYAARRLWRRKDVEEIDRVILDLICEALQRIGHSYRPKEGEGALRALAQAPSHIKELVSSLENLARPGIITPATASQVETTRTSRDDDALHQKTK